MFPKTRGHPVHGPVGVKGGFPIMARSHFLSSESDPILSADSSKQAPLLSFGLTERSHCRG